MYLLLGCNVCVTLGEKKKNIDKTLPGKKSIFKVTRIVYLFLYIIVVPTRIIEIDVNPYIYFICNRV